MNWISIVNIYAPSNLSNFPDIEKMRKINCTQNANILFAINNGNDLLAMIVAMNMFFIFQNHFYYFQKSCISCMHVCWMSMDLYTYICCFFLVNILICADSYRPLKYYSSCTWNLVIFLIGFPDSSKVLIRNFMIKFVSLELAMKLLLWFCIV